MATDFEMKVTEARIGEKTNKLLAEALYKSELEKRRQENEERRKEIDADQESFFRSVLKELPGTIVDRAQDPDFIAEAALTAAGGGVLGAAGKIPGVKQAIGSALSKALPRFNPNVLGSGAGGVASVEDAGGILKGLGRVITEFDPVSRIAHRQIKRKGLERIPYVGDVIRGGRQLKKGQLGRGAANLTFGAGEGAATINEARGVQDMLAGPSLTGEFLGQDRSYMQMAKDFANPPYDPTTRTTPQFNVQY